MPTHTRMIDKLTHYYGDSLYTHANQPYPVAFFPAQATQPIDAVLAPQHPTAFIDPLTFIVQDDAHLQQRRTQRVLTNGLSYMLDVLTPDPLRLSGKLGYYFDMMRTCDALDHELRDYARGDRNDTPLREIFHRKLPANNTLVAGHGRAALIGGAVLTVYRQNGHNGQYVALLAQRSASVATGAGLYHVFPAFVFQPSGPSAFYAAEWSMRHQIVREFGEELFAMPEFDQWPHPITSADYFYAYPPVADLLTMLADGRAELHLTGVAFNLLTLRPEICALLLIHDPEWIGRSTQALQAGNFIERQATHTIPLDTLAGLPENPALSLTPHGAVTFWQGVALARQFIAARGG